MKIAMWSGPRNLSTAMMYAFGNRGDCVVVDEPFYAPYLRVTGLDHPMRQEVLADGPRTPAEAIAGLPAGAPHLYLKLMVHHMQPGWPLDWADGYVHVHLIRHPARVIASYGAKRQRPELSDLGFREAAAMWQRFPGPVIDSADVRADPEGTLSRLCAEIGLPMSDRMLDWEAGPRPQDGVWAAHWYGAVHRSTGFAAAEGALPALDAHGRDILAHALPYYEAMRDRVL